MKRETGAEIWIKAMREHVSTLELSRLSKAESSHEAMLIPGCAVKSKERDGQDGVVPGMPTHHGRMIFIDRDQDKVVVTSHPEFGTHDVWTGTIPEYFAMWDCD